MGGIVVSVSSRGEMIWFGGPLFGVSSIVLAIVLVLFPRPASAAELPHYDLDSLCFQSNAVVLVTKVSERVIEPHRTLTTVQVERSYMPGELKAGDQIAIDLSYYPLEPAWGWPNRAKPTIAPGMVVFLRKNQDAAAQREPTPWSVVLSGARIFVDGKVHRFVQESNPGVYAPTPGEGASQQRPFDRPALERELERAVGHANEVHQALVAPPSAARTARLLDLLGPPPPPGVELSGLGEDQIGLAVLDAFAKEGNLAALFEARVRAPRVRAIHLPTRLDGEPLVAAATNRATPVVRRIGALQLLETHSGELDEHPDLGIELAKLFDDPDPGIRKALLSSVSFSEGHTPEAFIAAVVRRFEIEADPDVRFGLFVRARALKVDRQLDMVGIGLPLFRVRRSDDRIQIDWSGLDHDPGVPVSVVEAWSGGRVVARGDLTQEVTVSRGFYEGTFYAPLAFDRALAAGTYDLVVALQLKNVTADAAPFSRRLTLRTTFPQLTPARTADAAAPSPAAPRSRSCGCKVVGRSGGDLTPVLGALAVACGLTLRRRGRAP